jgi:DNA sulfur modification protein DndB
MNRLTNAVVDRVQLFKDKTDKERVSLSLRSKPFSTLSSVRAANVQLIGDIKEGSVTDAELQEREDFAASFWDHVTSVVQPWTEIADGTVEPAAAREDYLSSYAIALWAVGAVGRSAIEQGEAWEFIVAKLGEIDWLKTNPEWQGICMMGDEVITRQPTRKAMAEQLRWKLGLGPRPTPVLELAE